MVKLFMLIVALFVKTMVCKPWSLIENPLVFDHPCNGAKEITTFYELGKPPGEENQYCVVIDMILPVLSTIKMEFDSQASVELSNSTSLAARIGTWGDTFYIRLYYSANQVLFAVKGPPSGTVPYFKYLKINALEYCESPKVGYLDNYIAGYKDTAATELKVPEGCGRRKTYTGLMVYGEETKAGDWPWHVAIYDLNRINVQYICGGTLISKKLVLTVAHCVAVGGEAVPTDKLKVVLGKHNLIDEDLESQERMVQSVIVHEEFAPTNYLDNDIALLKLKTEATYSDYVQPACIWNSEPYDPTLNNTFGTVVGWGFDQSGSLSSQLKKATMPKIADLTCIKKNPTFYINVLSNDKKFCAGWANGTSACNGDSGGGFMVFVADPTNTDSSKVMGSWYIRGIVSMSTTRPNESICDPYQYVIFTDVYKYSEWIQRYMHSTS